MNEINDFAQSQIDDPRYLKSVTDLGATCPIVANRDIRSQSGVKLVSEGMHINSSVYERLYLHKLAPPLDQCLSAQNTVTGDSLAERASQMMREDDRLALIQSVQSEGGLLPHILKRVPLNPAIAFKLTVMRETQPELYQHSLYVALVSAYIGVQLRLKEEQLLHLATAALLHDIGILHVDQRLLARNHKMNEAERRHLYVHPVTGWIILKAYPEYTPVVLDAVLQHHERLDGSGYPRGIKADKIGQFGQIIAVAVIIASKYGKKNLRHEGARLETILKLNLRRYGRNLVNHLKVFCSEKKEVPLSSDVDKQLAQEKMARISAIFAAWEHAREQSAAEDPVFAFVAERMSNLKMEIVDAGLNPHADDESLSVIQEDPRACFDAMILLNETLWQLQRIMQETRRRWPSTDDGKSKYASDALSAWMSETETLL